MKITRDNYEEFFILYMDNELSAEQRREVELFAGQHTDLQEELNLLLQSRLVPDTSIVFDNKEDLLKTSALPSIDITNYEEWLLLYVDNELTGEQKAIVESFATVHPQVKLELQILHAARLQPETIAFPDKSVLYRKEEKVRVIAFNWRRIAVAAALIATIGTAGYLAIYNPGDNESGPLAANPDSVGQKNVAPRNLIVAPVAKKDPTDQQTTITIPDTKQENAITKPVDNQERTGSKIGADEIRTKRPLQQAASQTNAGIAVAPVNGNNLPVSAAGAASTKLDEPIAMTTVNDRASLTNSKENIQLPAVTTDQDEPLNDQIRFASNGPSIDPTDADQSGKKNKLRGFFRKVTRTFEKATNIKATDEEDRLLLGGLAIKL